MTYQFIMHNLDDLPSIALGEAYSIDLNSTAAISGLQSGLFRFDVPSDSQRIFVSDSHTTGLGEWGDIMTTWSVLSLEPDQPQYSVNSTTINRDFVEHFIDGGSQLLRISTSDSEPASLQFRILEAPSTIIDDITLDSLANAEITEPLMRREYRVDLQAGQILLYQSQDQAGEPLLIEIATPSGETLLVSSASNDQLFVAPERGPVYANGISAPNNRRRLRRVQRLRSLVGGNSTRTRNCFGIA